jgi:hypothetical protein
LSSSSEFTSNTCVPQQVLATHNFDAFDWSWAETLIEIACITHLLCNIINQVQYIHKHPAMGVYPVSSSFSASLDDTLSDLGESPSMLSGALFLLLWLLVRPSVSVVCCPSMQKKVGLYSRIQMLDGVVADVRPEAHHSWMFFPIYTRPYIVKLLSKKYA